ncbi:hypothetical protein [Kushneria phyllosphaerae]|uniref:Delta-aminolevulinic acid dehydratase n=1 Tax=Kushneria phyllosphaerae TaxID=2100822 RepID=A0A2R8CMS1_9GAMM|nr:hypothetical protein [Kushneria phyllosphaerae]SPJ34200.1 Delta-aminolevulinic acid dehydratase [Kushneria phyllosphaerae]
MFIQYECRHESAVDISEGADALMIKTGMFCPDVLYRVRQELRVSTFVYQASAGADAMVT